MKVTLIQMNSQADKEANVREALRLIEEAVQAERPDLVVLPEMFTFLGGTPEERKANAERIPGGPVYQAMSDAARRLGVVIHAGSMIETGEERCYNTTVVFGRDGKELAKYRKIHLFDVVTPDGKAYLESSAVGGGDRIVTYRLDDATVGCTICYDLRFPELFHRLREAESQIIVLPAAFTMQTGKDHWEPLVRARAIETQTYFLAAGQVFSYNGGQNTNYGHSMVVDPWGNVMAQMPDKVGWITATLDLDYLQDIRQKMPVLNHHVLV
jgi:nitrilase